MTYTLHWKEEEMVVEVTLRPGAFAWRRGIGHEFFPEGAHLKGELVRINEQKRIAVIKSKASHYTVNFEDVEDVSDQDEEASPSGQRRRWSN